MGRLYNRKLSKGHSLAFRLLKFGDRQLGTNQSILFRFQFLSLIFASSLFNFFFPIQVLPSSQNVLICGEYGAMTILDALSFEIIHILIPSDPTHWTLCYTVYQPPKAKDEEIVCMTLNGQVKTWNLQYDSKENMILESETKILSCPEPVCLTYNPRSLYNCLIVCESNWRIYRAGQRFYTYLSNWQDQLWQTLSLF